MVGGSSHWWFWLCTWFWTKIGNWIPWRGWHNLWSFFNSSINSTFIPLIYSYFPFRIANGSARRTSFKYQITGSQTSCFMTQVTAVAAPTLRGAARARFVYILLRPPCKWKKFLNKSSVRFLHIKKLPKSCYRQQKLCITDACLNFGYFNWILNFPTFVSVQILILSAANKMQTSIVFPT